MVPGVYVVPGGVPGLGDVPGPRGHLASLGGHLVPGVGGCTWSQGDLASPGGHLVLAGAPGPRRGTWSWGVPGLGGCTWSGTPPLWTES